MDAFELLAAQLLRDQSQEQTNNPYTSGAAGIDSVLATLPRYHVKPWESLLAGALGGFASGALKGIGTASADQKTSGIAQKLAAALELNGPAQTDAFKDPELSKYGVINQIATIQEKRDSEKLRRQALTDALLKPKQMRTIHQGLNDVQQEFDPLAQKWSPVGEPSPRFAPRAETGMDAAVQPLIAQQLSRALGVDVSDPAIAAASKDYKTINALKGLDLSADVADRSALTKSRELKKSSLFGYEPVSDEVMLSPGEAKDWREKIATTNNILYKFDILAKSDDLSAISGQDSATQAAVSSELFNKFRVLTNSGARLEPREEEMIRAMMPRVAAGDLAGAIKAGALGRDQKQFAADMGVLLKKGLDVELISVGYKNKNRPLEDYPRGTLDSLGISPPTPETPGLGVPKRNPGESVAQYRARTGL